VEPVRLEVEAPIEEAELVHRITQRGAAVTPPPSPTTRPVLICVGGALNGQEFEIPPSGLVVGREGHVRVPDEFLSRRHFEVGPDPDGTIRVRDLGSRNGTFLNTLPATNTKVQSGDEIRAGINRFRIEQR
jgi:pSer/pThr/pTyr-binding forkhead associated (FHA) protein